MSIQFVSFFLRLSAFLLLTTSSIYSVAVEVKTGKITGGSTYEIPSWFTGSFLDIAEDVDDAKDDNKSVLLYFHLDNCPYCSSMLDQNFKSGDNLEFIQKHFSVIAVNLKGDREITLNENETLLEKELSKNLKVQYTPTIIFISEDGKQVFRTNGYRTPKAFRHVLEYVVSQSYKNTTLSDYVESNQKSSKGYTFIEYSGLEKVSYLQNYKQPVAILFEDKDCIDCKNFHEKLIDRDDVKAELSKYLFIRFDAYSNQKITDFDGKTTSPRKMVKDFDLNYRPGILLFNEGKNITKIDGQLYSFHFNTVLRYVSGKHYQDFPRFGDYLKVRQLELLEQGIDINIVD
jgi:thioredoxin-related protein